MTEEVPRRESRDVEDEPAIAAGRDLELVAVELRIGRDDRHARRQQDRRRRDVDRAADRARSCVELRAVDEVGERPGEDDAGRARREVDERPARGERVAADLDELVLRARGEREEQDRDEDEAAHQFIRSSP